MITFDTIADHPAIHLENDLLRISILPAKGADIYQLTYKEGEIDFLYKTFPGLRPPLDGPLNNIIDNYEGGWQELFPNTGDACNYHGAVIPIHGEVATLPWEYSILTNGANESAVTFSVVTRLTSFRLERTMRLPGGAARLEIEETVTNLSDSVVDFVWGHHLVLGGDFLESGCHYDAAARTIWVPANPKQRAHARLAPGQCQPWPMAKPIYQGELIDLQQIPGPEINSHDEVYLNDLERGEASLYNPRLRLKFKLTWDPSIFGCLVMWQPFGGLDIHPWTGSYGVGMEPWTACSNLEGAIETGKSLKLQAKESLKTTLWAEVLKG